MIILLLNHFFSNMKKDDKSSKNYIDCYNDYCLHNSLKYKYLNQVEALYLSAVYI